MAGLEGPSPLEIDPRVGHAEVAEFSISVPDQEITRPAPHGSPSLPMTKSGIFGTSSNLVNSIVGAGIIGIPYAFKQSGLVAGVLLLIIVAYMTDKSLRIIVELASFHPKIKHRNVRSYEDLMSYPFGKAGSTFVLVNMLVLAYGAMVAYLLIIKDTVPTILGIANGTTGGFVERELVMVVTSLIIILPLAIQRDMASLAITSVLSVLADVMLVIFIAVFAPISQTVAAAGGFGQVLTDEWLNPTIFIGLGILSTAMACQHSAFIVSGSLENKTQARWASVTFRSITTAALLCIVLGICGYLGFLAGTEGDVLNNFDGNTVAANGARALLAVTMFFTYPMESFVARHVALKIFFGGCIDGPLDESGNPQPEFFGLSRRVAVTIGIYIATLIPALIVDDIGPVLSITGSLGGSMLSYMAPGMVYLGVNGEHFTAWANNLVETHQFRQTKKADGDIDLPMDGDATQEMQQPQLHMSGSKPWWWFPTFMPIWCALASSGARGMKDNLGDDSHVSAANHDDDDNGDVVHPRARDYIISIFFIVFGTIGMVAGVLSNVYVQVNNVFYSPH